MLNIGLRRDGHKVESVKSGEDAKKKLDGALYDVIVTDIKMPNIDGIEVLRYAHQVSPDSAVILITAVDDYEAAGEAVKSRSGTRTNPKTSGLWGEVQNPLLRALGKISVDRPQFDRKR